jgi:hypothetical protein
MAQRFRPGSSRGIAALHRLADRFCFSPKNGGPDHAVPVIFVVAISVRSRRIHWGDGLAGGGRGIRTTVIGWPCCSRQEFIGCPDDDFPMIRARMEELRRERAQLLRSRLCRYRPSRDTGQGTE